MANTRLFYKDPDSTLPFEIDWTTWLAGDDIASSSWTLPDELTYVGETQTDKKTTISFTGGRNGTRYRVTNHIVTDGALTEDLTLMFYISQN